METNRFAEAEVADNDAVVIQRELAAQYPPTYRPLLAGTLDDLGTCLRRARITSPDRGRP